jgi:hypothetical protein
MTNPVNVYNTVEDSILSLLQARVTVIGSERIKAISDESEVAKAVQNPPVILIRYIGATPDDETDSAYGVWRIGRPIATRRRFSWATILASKRLRSRSGRKGDAGIYDMQSEVDAALLGKTPAGAAGPLYWTGDAMVEVEDVHETDLLHGATYECDVYVTEEVTSPAVIAGEDTELAGESAGLGGGP